MEKGLIALSHLLVNNQITAATLAERTDCSPQTALRILDRLANHFPQFIVREKDGHKIVYRLAKKIPAKLTESLTERSLLWIVLAANFSGRLLPPEIQKIVDQGLTQIFQERWPKKELPAQPFPPIKALSRGSINFGGETTDILERIIEAINQKKACQITYSRKDGDKTKDLAIAPVELASFREAIYVFGHLVEIRPRSLKLLYKITLSAQRIRSVKVLDRDTSKLPQNVSFHDEAVFGIIQDEPFELNVNFSPSVAHYVKERQWCQKQELTELTDGRWKLRMTCGNTHETINWLLSFGPTATIIAPKEFRDQFLATLQATAENYNLQLVRAAEMEPGPDED
jgi:proteasome accessory factor B